MAAINPNEGNASRRNTEWAKECGLLPDKMVRRWSIEQGYDQLTEIHVTYLVDEDSLNRFTDGKKE